MTSLRNVLHSFVDGVFLKLKSKIKLLYDFKTTTISQLKYLDKNIDKYLEIMFDKVGIVFEKLKMKIDHAMLMYKTYASKYTGGSKRILSRFGHQFVNDISSFITSYVQFMDSYAGGNTALNFYQEWKEILDFFHISLENLNQLKNDIQR